MSGRTVIGHGETQDMTHTRHMGPKDMGRKHTGHGTHKTYGTKGHGKKPHRTWDTQNQRTWEESTQTWDIEHGAIKDQGLFARY